MLEDRLITFIKNFNNNRDLSHLFLTIIDGDLVVNEQGFGLCLDCIEYTTDLGSSVEYLMDCLA